MAAIARFLVVSFAALMSWASPTLAREVESLQPLLLEAIDRGSADGVLVGPMAQTFAELFKTTAPLHFSVTTVGDLSPGCKRVQVRASQDSVGDRNSKTVAAAPESRQLTYRVSMCRDGSYPEPSRAGAPR